MVEYDTWVPFLRDHVLYRIPRPVRWGAGLALLAYLVSYAREAAFYLAILVAGNYAVLMAEQWTAARDRVAVQAGVATGGWGGLLRTQEEREVRRKTETSRD